MPTSKGEGKVVSGEGHCERSVHGGKVRQVGLSWIVSSDFCDVDNKFFCQKFGSAYCRDMRRGKKD